MKQFHNVYGPRSVTLILTLGTDKVIPLFDLSKRDVSDGQALREDEKVVFHGICRSANRFVINQSINQSEFYSANIPGEARLSGVTAKSVFNSKIEETVP